MSTTHLFTGLQPFWNYDSFTVKAKGFGSGIGRINVAGGKLVDAGSGENPYSLPTDFNFSFQSFELALKFHNNPPMLTRFWNSSENDQTVSLNDHFGLFGKWWTSNYEHGLVENTGDNIVTEIGPSGERNVYTESGGNYTSPAGILKDLSKTSGEFDLMTRGYYTYHFKHLTSDETNLYRLEYIKDKNNVRVYVVWESVAGKYRIKNIAVSTDSGTTKTNVLSFKYVTLEISSTTYHFISEITDNANRVWSYTYDTDNKGLLVRAHYPSGIDVEYVYNTSGGSPTYNLEQIIDPRKHAWIVDYTNKLWKIQVGGEWHYTYYDWSIDTATGVVTCTKRDPRSSSSSDDNYRTVYTTNTSGNITGNIVSRKIADTSSSTWIEWKYEWTNNRTTKFTEPNAVDSANRNYTTYSYNVDGLTEYVKKFKADVEQARYRQKYSYNSETAKYELASIEYDFSDGTYYFNKSELSYDSNHNLINRIDGINPDPDRTCDPDEISLNISNHYEYDDRGNLISSIDPEGNRATYEYDEFGSLTKYTDPSGNVSTYEYDSLSLVVTSKKDANNNLSKQLIDDALIMRGYWDPLGNVANYTFDCSGNITQIFTSSGLYTFAYDEKNRLIEQTEPCGLTTYFAYTKNDLQQNKHYYMLDGDSITATKFENIYFYYNSGRLYQYTNAENEVYELVYDKSGNLVSMKNPNGNVENTKTYNFVNDVETITYPTVNGYSGSITIEYNGPMGLKSKVTATSTYSMVDTDLETTYTYDRKGRLYKLVKPQVTYGVTTYTFTNYYYLNGNDKITKIINEKYDGITTSSTYSTSKYDKSGRRIETRELISEDDNGSVANEAITCYSYDPNGNVISVSKNGIITVKYSYDQLGRLIETRLASGERSVQMYGNSSSNPSVKYFNQSYGGLVTYTYDGVGQVKNIDSDLSENRTTICYDVNGRISCEMDSSGKTISYKYFPNGWLERLVLSDCNYYQYSYDKVGRMTRVETIAPDHEGNNYEGRNVVEIKHGWGIYTPTNGTGFSSEHNYERYIEYVTNKSATPHYFGTVYFYDVNNRLSEIRFLDDDDSTERKYRYTYDGIGNMVKVDKPDASSINYEFNKLAQMTKEIYDATNYNEFEYCCCSLKKHQQTINGTPEEPFVYTYDKKHRLIREQYPDSGTPKTQYFDYVYNNADMRQELYDPTYGLESDIPIRNSYDSDGKLVRIGRSKNDNYNYSDGEDYHIEYTKDRKIKKVLYPGSNNVPIMEIEYGYNSSGQVKMIIARDITDSKATDIYCIEYQFDVRGRRISRVIKERESDTEKDAFYVTRFEYDTRDMLVSENYLRWNSGNNNWDILYQGSYKYDTAGNIVYRKFKQLDGVTLKIFYDDTFTYSRGFQLRSFRRNAVLSGGDESRTVNLTYDSNGNCTHILQTGSFTDNAFYGVIEMEFQFDPNNRLTKYRYNGTGNWYEIKYDSVGQVRERIDTATVAKKFYYTGEGLVQELDSSDEVDFDYLIGPSGLLRQTDETGAGGERRFYIKDSVDTVWALVDPSDLSVSRYNYNSFGEHLDKDGSFPTEANSRRFNSGRVEGFGDSTNDRQGIYQFGVRNYLTELGIFLQRDPLLLRRPSNPRNTLQGNPYIFADQNPVMKNDPTGMIACGTPAGQNDIWFDGCYNPWDSLSFTIPGNTPFHCDCGSANWYMDDMNMRMNHIRVIMPNGNVLYGTIAGLSGDPYYSNVRLCLEYKLVKAAGWEIYNPGRLCCHILQNCSPWNCTPDARQAEEIKILAMDLATINYQDSRTTGGCPHHPWHNSTLKLGWEANAMGTASGDIENGVIPCGCLDWQAQTSKRESPLWILNEVVCFRLLAIDAYSYSIIAQHHWMSYRDCKNPPKFWALDGWGYGDWIPYEIDAENNVGPALIKRSTINTGSRC